MKNTIKVVIVPVGKTPYVADIENNLKSLQGVVGGLIEVVPLENGTLAICDEEGKLKNKDGNRRIGNDIIAGDFIVCGDNQEGEFCSLTQHQISLTLSKFSHIDTFTDEEVLDSIVVRFFGIDDTVKF